MARNVRSPKLENRTGRLKLGIRRRPHFVRIDDGVSLGYRRTKTDGSWVLKVSNGKGGCKTLKIGQADDYQEANGSNVYDFWAAQAVARKEARKLIGDANLNGPLTTSQAAEAYLKVLAAKNSRTEKDTRSRLKRLFLNQFGDRAVASLTKKDLEEWLVSLVSVDKDEDKKRKSKDTANRVLTMVKATLNHAFQDPSNGLDDDKAWRLVKPFKDVSKPRDIRYTQEQVLNLVDAAEGQDTKDLITGLYLTGARYGELAKAKVKEFDGAKKTLFVSGKTGQRNIILQKCAHDFMSRLIQEKTAEDHLFRRSNNDAWKPSEQTRPVKAALKAAGLPLNGCLYALRHTHISEAIENNVPIIVIAENCGTSVRMIEKTYAKVLAEKKREFIDKGMPSI